MHDKVTIGLGLYQISGTKFWQRQKYRWTRSLEYRRPTE